MSKAINNRYDFVYLFDVTDGNPNGDPDAGNLPRVDPETMQGLVTDVCLKRKIRNYITLKFANEPPHEIYVKERAVLNNQHERAYSALEIKPEPKKLPKDEAKAKAVTAWMCQNFFDIRTFGAVMTTEVNAGQVRGPLQLTMARSIDPIVPAEFAVTRCAVTKQEDLEKERTIGRKFAVPYAIYKGYGYINPALAAQTGFSQDDLELVKEALAQMFEADRSAARGLMKPVRCIAFKHEQKLGGARADQLFSRVTVNRKEATDSANAPRSESDYEIIVDTKDLPAGISIEEWI